MTILIAIFSHLLAVISPGPDTAIILKTAIAKGRSEAQLVAYGIGVGIFFHCLFASVGLQLIQELIPNILSYISTVGGLYFIYIGVTSIIGSYSKKPNKVKVQKKSYFFTGFLVNILNTKALLFFIALFAYLKTQVDYSFMFSLYFPIATCMWFLFLGYLISTLKKDVVFLNSNVLNYVFSVFFIVAGILIFLSR